LSCQSATAHDSVLRKRVSPPAVALVALLAIHSALAQTNVANPDLEARVKALSAELRCLVCQNQTVADSDAPVARDMREQVRAQLAAGKSEAEVKHYMTERFGDFVLYKPPMKAGTFVLWFAPFAALLLGAFFLMRRIRRAPSSAASPVLTDDERARAKALLEEQSS
jgi:cytochrome c-type biogenesis protein CcmH